jgi:cellulose synthase/poly-beta-1,6-N-acetylglucosamine synthase-like glycosyltransferase
MWLLETLFVFVTLLLAWIMFGFLITGWFVGRFQKRKKPDLSCAWPSMSIIVPCFNEETDILKKLENLRGLDYPKDRIEIVFADGGSTDKTLGLLEPELRMGEKITRCPTGGKINQMNYALPQLKGEIIVNTDVDAMMEPDALKWLAAEFAADPSVMVAGAYCSPVNALDVEKYYWDAQNRARLIESDWMSSSIVVAPCYAFKRYLLKSFPEDVVADDIFVALSASSIGFRTVYSRNARCVETRNPQTLSDFLPHKFRKSNAYLRETLRFLYRLPDMNIPCKIILLTKLAQQFFLPWTIILWAMLAGSLLTSSLGLWSPSSGWQTLVQKYDILGTSFVFLFLMALITHKVFSWVPMPAGPKPKF